MICNVVGARPNFMKMAPIVKILKQEGIEQILVHTGQHYDAAMSEVFFTELGMPQPDVYLNVGSGSHATQTAAVMVGFERACLEHQPRRVVVAGDVNSTVAAALVAAKLGIPVAHVEAGLRSFDRAMPEELNRVVTDHLCDLLFASEPSGVVNLLREGIPQDKIHLVGNCMVDSLFQHIDAARRLAPWRDLGLKSRQYALLTLHRPANVDDVQVLQSILQAMERVSHELPVVFPVHPRTRSRIASFGLRLGSSIKLCDPLPYLTFLGFMDQARVVLTDSGGIQEETTALGVPCLTLRSNTERPITLSHGTNRLVPRQPDAIVNAVKDVLQAAPPTAAPPELWDGRAAERVVAILTRGDLLCQ